MFKDEMLLNSLFLSQKILFVGFNNLSKTMCDMKEFIAKVSFTFAKLFRWDHDPFLSIIRQIFRVQPWTILKKNADIMKYFISKTNKHFNHQIYSFLTYTIMN